MNSHQDLLQRFTPDELEFLVNLEEGDAEQKLTPEELDTASAILKKIDDKVEFLQPG